MIYRTVEVQITIYNDKDVIKEQKIIVLEELKLKTAEKIKKNLRHKINEIIAEDL